VTATLASYDTTIARIAAFAADPPPLDDRLERTAIDALLDALGCAVLGATVDRPRAILAQALRDRPGPVPIPGTYLRRAPLEAAFGLSCLIRWLDYNDTYLALEWGHPSDNLGGLIAAAYASGRDWTIGELTRYVGAAYEIQGALSEAAALNAHGFDHIAYVRVATAASACALLGGTAIEIANAVSNAFVDGATLRCYRHAPDAGERKSWAAAEAAARGLELALRAREGEPGYPHALTTPRWGFEAACLGGTPFTLPRPLTSRVLEQLLFKVPYPAEYHAQSALEAAIALSPLVRDRVSEVAEIVIETQEAGATIIAKQGPLHSPADRDHSLDYIVAIGLIDGALSHHDYEDERAADPKIERLRSVTRIVEEPSFTAAYHDPAERAVPNAVSVRFRDGIATKRVEVRFPLGHPRRRAEASEAIAAKLAANLAAAGLSPPAILSRREELRSTPLATLLGHLATG